MPANPRVRGNNSFGITTDNPLAAGATSFNSAGLITLPTVLTQHATITLDPLREFGEPEIIVVTVHTFMSTIATVTRGQYNTTARSHPQGTLWLHAPLDEDFIEILTSVTRPTDPYRGQGIFETDSNRYVGRSTADAWQQMGLFFDPPACKITHSVAQSIADASATTVAFDSEVYDTDSMHDIVTNNSRITINTAGLYLFVFDGNFITGADYLSLQGFFQITAGAPFGVTVVGTLTDTGVGAHMNTASVRKMAVGESVTVTVRQNNSANTARNLEKNVEFSPYFSATWIGRGN